jgi:hypothetical protein
VDPASEPTAPTTAPISEDSDVIVRVPVVSSLAALPYWAHHQQYQHHADGCPECSDPGSMLPCPVGGAVSTAMLDAIESTRDTARWN